MKVAPLNDEKQVFKVEIGRDTLLLTPQQMITLQSLLQKELNNIKF